MSAIRTLGFGVALACLPLTVSAVQAATFDLNATLSGYYQNGGTSPNTNSLIEDSTRNNYVTFDLSSVTGTVTSAVLTFFANGNYSNGTGAASITYTLYDVSTPVSVLNARSTSLAAFADLGSGNVYGSAVVNTPLSSAAMPELVISLLPAAVTDINAALAGNGLFAVGGNSNLAGNAGFLWISSSLSPAAKLTLTTVAPVPAPASLPLFGAALGLVAMLRRKRRV